MANGQHDPVKDWLVETYRAIVGDPAQKAEDRAYDPTQRIFPLSVLVAAAAVLALRGPVLVAKVADRVPALTDIAARLHDYRVLLIVVAGAVAVVDLARYLARRYRILLTALVRQALRDEPVRVTVWFPPGVFAVRHATVKLPPGTIIRPREFDELTSAIKKSGLLRHGRIAVAVRRLVLDVLAKQVPALQGRSKGWTLMVRHEPHRDLLVVTRSLLAQRNRSALGTLDRVVRDSPLKDPVVSVESRDDDGVETGYRIAFTPTLNTGAKAFQTRVEESLATLAGRHVSGRQWVTEWHPDDGYLVMRLQAPLPRRVDHPLELVDEDLRHLPFGTGAADLTVFWDVSTKSNKPHCLIVGPTGGGKTSVIRTLLTEAARRGIPFLGVDPKMIELDGLEGYPGCGAIVYDPMRAAMMVRALHAEMMARNHYVHVKKIEPSQLPLLIAVLDEFFILSGKWQRLMKSGDEATRKLLAELDPLGAWADLAVLARSAGIRLLLGVQRPDAQLFGSSSGNARDNFGTRMSLGNLSQDGALMMWGDAQVGRDVDTSIPGRGMVTAPDGSPVSAQMWWTPNVDRHPNKWNQLSDDEKALIEGLVPAEAPQFTIYSPELREFIESERALAKQARERGEAPEPFVLGASDDDAADAIPASAVTEGMTILVDDEDSNLVPVTAEQVTVIRDETTGAVTETRIVIATSGRVKTTLHFTVGEVVFLPEPDPVPAAA
ncbi:FtsK/SpoIIIE domain-containing protein [Nocardia pseudovaccinii]|uniref:FtsK/SpoIIIE domain-containing protein n=1 Tax=Nocardia pseudovaccinii TaxID=189540 RepID=UPI0007A39AD2|nr:FtsK/SpoIIIE domain-containing protein [Nocardia pseudovaccinii]